MSRPRKQRSDAGKTTLTHDEMLTISGRGWRLLVRNGKKGYSLEDIVDGLRDNNLIIAGRTDTDTGEFFPLSIDAISRAPPASYAPRPVAGTISCPELASLHPNHVWQLDASICVLYYLKNPAKGQRGHRAARHERGRVQQNKPRNLDRIVNDRVWSFEITDHTTGWIYVEYRFGGRVPSTFWR